MRISKYHIIGSMLGLGLGIVIADIINNELEYDNYTIIPITDTHFEGAVLVKNVDDQQIHGFCGNLRDSYQNGGFNFLVGVDETGDLYADKIFIDEEELNHDNFDTTMVNNFLTTADKKMSDIEKHFNDWKNITDENNDYSMIFFINNTIIQHADYSGPFAGLNGILLLKNVDGNKGCCYGEDIVGFSGEFTDPVENITKSIVTLRKDGITQVFINGEEDKTGLYNDKARELLQKGWTPYVVIDHLKYRSNFRAAIDPVFKFACEVEDFGQDVEDFIDYKAPYAILDALEWAGMISE